MKNKSKLFLKIAVIVLIVGAIFSYSYYTKIYKSNVEISGESIYLYIPTGSNFEKVCEIIATENIVKDLESFKWVAIKKNYPNKIKAGRYKIKNGMNNNQLITLLRSGNQEPVKLTFNNIRLQADFAGRIGKLIESDSISLLKALSNNEIQEKYGFNSDNFLVMFIPNTYVLNWNTSAEKFIDRMYSEYQLFWNETRKQQANALGLSPIEVSILASIVEQEMRHPDEMPKIAGVYLNRLRIKMKLEADPTVKFAAKDFAAKRVTNRLLETDSPYNTYKYSGLPPGPICMPMSTSIDAVLNYESHDFIYFCAKENFDGYHNFAKTLDQHLNNARRYQNALNQNKIF